MLNKRVPIFLMLACGIILATSGCSSNDEKPNPPLPTGAKTPATSSSEAVGGGGTTPVTGQKAPFDPSK